MENVKIRLLRMGIVIMAFAVTASLVNRPHIGAAGNSGRIVLNKTSISVREGITGKITVKNKPAGAKVLWSIKNKKTASVKGGVITGLKQGKTVVTCKVVYQQGQKKKTKKLKATVTVRNNKQIYPKHKPYGKGIGARPGRLSGAIILNL